MADARDILLVNPPWHKARGNIWRKVAGVVPPLGLASLAAVAERAGMRVEIIDAQALGLGEEQTRDAIARAPARWIGFTATTPIVNAAYRLAAGAAAAHPGAGIVMGGPHVSALPDEPFERAPGIIVLRGEAENSFVDLVKEKPFSEIAGLSWNDNGSVRHNPVGPLIENLDELPRPAYHLLPIRNYRPSLGNYRRLPALSIIATRGCYGRCTFCYREIFGSVVRVRSAALVIEELKYLRRVHGIRDVSFYDDVFMGTKKKIREFCELMLKEKPDVIWLCNLRGELTDPETLKLMKHAGCYAVDYGVESGDPDVLASMKKNVELERTTECIRMARAAGMDIKCGFIIGAPGETSATLKATLETAMKIEPDTAMFNIATPFPGTDMFQWAEKENRLQSRDWDLYDYSHVILKLPELQDDEVLSFYKTVYRKFYLRSKYIFRRLLKLRNPANLKMAAEAFIAIVQLVFFEERERKQV
jgi:radical SAM superfamily enzyme YgiQ (UPF0313 family)